LISTESSVLKLCCPTYVTSIAELHGIAICTPALHCVDAGRSPAYSNTLSAGAASVVKPPLPSVCNCPYRTVRFLIVGGFWTCG